MSETIVSLEKVSWRQENRMILNEITWLVQRNQHWVILGLNGSGKTSLLNMITGYLWPSKGNVCVLGHEYGKVNIPELRKSIGWVSASLDQQVANRLDDVLDVVISGKYASIGLYEKSTMEDKLRASDIVETLGISHLKTRYFYKLSQGEKRRVLIGRALMANPDILILDEPCNGLDLYAKEQLLSMLKQFANDKGGPTMIYVTHHIEEMISAFTHVLLLRDGKVVAAGEKRDVLTKATLTEAYNLSVDITWKHDRPWVHVID
ncbi:ABC transporter ATP-binding protein [Halalkalibacter hemicellulosilyticus]|uniref:ABC transporter n=1 Tax=Halalkalibacter hemicellulosilyticusJCM 9152 TaxID=1236971 RepID=W4QCX5_9BACI|nr:ABC transporter ATP-binding protein [Halalkalibacter hemicellulosilyticus]GAE29890.1 ABC transporter [Halalkalibacter hemicellulosilyticusJCM 9152]